MWISEATSGESDDIKRLMACDAVYSLAVHN